MSLKNHWAAVLAVGIATPLFAQIESVQSGRAPGLVAVPVADVRINDPFWSPRIETTRTTTLAHNFEECEITGRLSNFAKAAGRQDGEFEGLFFNDSDVYKALEGAAYQLALSDDPAIRERVDRLIADIVAAQEDDGYINTFVTLNKSEKRWTNIRDRHELYCGGHLIEAAIAHHMATGERTLLDVAIRWADLVDATFGPEDGKLRYPPGHEEIELALVKLWRLTGEERYFRLAQFFIEERGRPHTDGNVYGEYAQDDVPVTEQTEIVGHAVRAMYLYCAMADVASATGNEAYIDAMDLVWNDLVGAKMYITGGIGPSAHNEGFTVAYDLPNATSYAETCGSIGMALWNHRLSMLHHDAKYFDVFERVLYNGLLSGVSLDGDEFFYVNRLSSIGQDRRADWFSCACCPPNVLRFLSSISGTIYAQPPGGDSPDLFVNLYVSSDADITVGGRQVRVTQQTRYPWTGRIDLSIEYEGDPLPMRLHLRVPAWARSHQASINNQNISAEPGKDGYLTLDRIWTSGDRVRIEFPMAIERMRSHPEVKSNVGKVALTRGPIVYCLEQADNETDVRRMVLTPGVPLESVFRDDLLGGVMTISGSALASSGEDWEQGDLYLAAGTVRQVPFTAIPYYAWANREPGAMIVWAAESFGALGPTPATGITASASHVYQNDTCDAMFDRQTPTSSVDQSIPRHTFWPRKGSSEWVQYDFDEPRDVSGVEVYWFDDSSLGAGCSVPKSCEVMVRLAGSEQWVTPQDIDTTVQVGVKADQFNTTRFGRVHADALRLNITLREDRSGGILEWRLLR